MENSVKRSSFKSENPLFLYNFDVIIICFSLCVPAVYYGGATALLQIFSCVLTSVVSEFISSKLVLKRNPLSDLSAVATGLLIALMLPSCAPLYVGISACLFAVLVAKLPFGGCTPFVPSCVGIAFAVMAFKKEISTYAASSSGANLIFSNQENFVFGTDLASMLSKGDCLTLNIFGRIDLLSGSIPGAMGTTCILALIGAAVYLLIRRSDKLLSSFGYLLSVAVLALIFPRVNSGRLSSAVMEICAGGIIFTALLLINEPFTSPKSKVSSFIYGVLGGVSVMLLRYFSDIPLPEVFSVLIMNAFWPAFASKFSKAKVYDNSESTSPYGIKEVQTK